MFFPITPKFIFGTEGKWSLNHTSCKVDFLVNATKYLNLHFFSSYHTYLRFNSIFTASIISCFIFSSSFLISSMISSFNLSKSPADAPPAAESPIPLTLGAPSSDVEPNLFLGGLGDSGPGFPLLEVLPGLFCDDLGGSWDCVGDDGGSLFLALRRASVAAISSIIDIIPPKPGLSPEPRPMLPPELLEPVLSLSGARVLRNFAPAKAAARPLFPDGSSDDDCDRASPPGGGGGGGGAPAPGGAGGAGGGGGPPGGGAGGPPIGGAGGAGGPPIGGAAGIGGPEEGSGGGPPDGRGGGGPPMGGAGGAGGGALGAEFVRW